MPSLCKTARQFFKELNVELAQDPAIMFLGISFKKLKTKSMNVHNSLVHNSQKVETSQFVNGQINVVYPCKEIILSRRKK